MPMHFAGGFSKNYTSTITRAVGPSTQSGARGTLPQPAPSDANSIWLAKNGNDANAGTQAAPKLTVAGAVAALGGAKTTIHIFRNGFVGQLLFTITADVALNTFNMQVENGEIAYITSNIVFHFFTITTGIVNGIVFIDFINQGIIARVTGTGKYSNCDFSLSQITINNGAVTTILEYCVLDISLWLPTAVGCVVNINNCAIILPLESDTFEIVNNVTSTGSMTLNFNRCILYKKLVSSDYINNGAAQGIILLFDQLATGTRTWNINVVSSYIYCPQAFVHTENLTNNTNIINVIFNKCQNNTSYNIFKGRNGVVPGTFTDTFTFTNPISVLGLPVLFIDVTNGVLNKDANLLRLQATGKTVPNSTDKFLLNSPLIGAGVGGVDVNPWDESTALTSQSYAAPIPIIWAPSGLKPTPARFINPTELNDIQGGPHSGFDAIRRAWELSFGDGTFYANNQDLWRLALILSDSGTQQWFPRGVGNSIFTDPNGNAKANQGQYNAANKSFTPFIASGIPLIPQHWAGYWIILTVSGVDKHFYILSNNSISFTLTDKLAATLPATGEYYFRIEYILIRFALKDLETVQQYFTKFLQGGSWGEFGTTLQSRANTLAHELTGYSIRLLEAVDPEEPQ